MKHWEILRGTFKVSDFISWQKAQTLVLSPSFQRRPVWKPGAKSYLLDTIIRGLPMPIIIIRDQKTDLNQLEPLREVVDGQQRLRTVISFIKPSLLPDYDSAKDDFTIKAAHNKELAGMKFVDLPTDIRQQILDYQFSVHTLPSQVDDREVLQIFSRLNATGLKLSRQELRNAEFVGEFKISMYDLASEQLYRWRSWGVFREDDIARMQEVELTSEIATLMFRGVTHKSQSTIDKLYKDFDDTFPNRTEVERRFRTIMDTIDDKLGTEMKNLPLRRKTIIYDLLAFIYDVQFGIESPLHKVRPQSVSPDVIARIRLASERIQNKTAPKEVLESVERRTTNPGSRLSVIKYLHSVKLGAKASS